MKYRDEEPDATRVGCGCLAVLVGLAFKLGGIALVVVFVVWILRSMGVIP
mgnify:FL=1